MRRPAALAAAAALCLAGLAGTAATANASGHPEGSSDSRPSYVPVCPVTAVVQCRALVRTDVHGLGANGQPNGYGPADLRSAYQLPKGGQGVTVAITGLG